MTDKLSVTPTLYALVTVYIIADLLTGYRLVIVCSNENEEQSHIINKLHRYRRQFAEPANDEQMRLYLKSHLTDKALNDFAASVVDHEKYIMIILS